MEAVMEIVFHIVITVAAMVGLAIKIEHRLTDLEADIRWLKRNLNNRTKKE